MVYIELSSLNSYSKYCTGKKPDELLDAVVHAEEVDCGLVGGLDGVLFAVNGCADVEVFDGPKLVLGL